MGGVTLHRVPPAECLMTRRERTATRTTATAAALVILKRQANRKPRSVEEMLPHFVNLQWAPGALAPVILSILLLSCSHLWSLRCCVSTHTGMSYLAQGYAEAGGQSENRLSVWPLCPEKSLSGTDSRNKIRRNALLQSLTASWLSGKKKKENPERACAC